MADPMQAGLPASERLKVQGAGLVGQVIRIMSQIKILE